MVVMPVRAQCLLNRDFLRRKSFDDSLYPFRVPLRCVDKDTLFPGADDVGVCSLEAELWLRLALVVVGASAG
jgi:hypothetical protein